MSLDIPLNNNSGCYVGSQQSLPCIHMCNEEKDSSNFVNRGDAYTTSNYYNSNISTNFRSVKSLSSYFYSILIILMFFIIFRFKKLNNII